MDTLLKQPYELSLWDDKVIYIVKRNGEIIETTALNSSDEILNNVRREVKVAVIGVNDSNSPINAHDVNFIENLNGSHELTFTLYDKFYDEDLLTIRDNPFLSLMVNERKIKLYFNNEWYHFIIKKCNESSDKHSFVYECTDQYIDELSKTGYDIEFSTDLENNIGTISTLTNTILEQSDWTLDPNSELLKQRSQENLYVYTLPINKSIIGVVMEDFTDPITKITVHKGDTKTINGDTVIYVFYPSVVNNETDNQHTDYQFLYVDKGSEYYQDADGNIINSPNYSVSYDNFTSAGCIKQYLSSTYFGKMLVSQQLTHYCEKIDKICTEYTKDDINYYCYTKQEYMSHTSVENTIKNATNYLSSASWSNDTNNITLGTTTDGKNTINGALPLKNSGFYESRAILSDGIAKESNWWIAIKFNSGAAYLSGATVIAYKGTTATTLLTFNSSTPASAPSGYTYLKASATDAISYKTLTEYNNIVVSFSGSGVVSILDAKLFRENLDEDGTLIIPDLAQDLTTVIKTKYYFFKQSKLDDSSVVTIDDLSYDAIQYDDSGFTKKNSSTYEKVRTITQSKSNRFNLIQDLCELFECWAKFTIGTFSQYPGVPSYEYIPTTDSSLIAGKTYYITTGKPIENTYPDIGYQIFKGEYSSTQTYYERKYHKYVTYKEFIGKENDAGFRHGINLSGITRKLESDKIVTKLIVEENANEYSSNGSCTIQQSILNPTGEQAIYNFEYYIKQGLLSREDLYRDLYDDTNGIGYFTKLRTINTTIRPSINELSEVGITLTKLESRQTLYEALMSSAQVNYEEAISNIVGALNCTEQQAKTITYDSGKHTDTIHGYILTRDYNKNVITQYTSELTNIKALVTTYKTKYNNLISLLKTYEDEKRNLNRQFYSQYNRFIKEGSWISEDYTDPELYYLDGTKVLYSSAFPEVSYTIDVIDLSVLSEYQLYSFEIGDKTYIEDTEFFGYSDNGKPYQEEVVLSKISRNLDNPAENKITIQNYRTQFEDLFQRITATTQSLSYAEGSYNRASEKVNQENVKFLQDSLKESTALVLKGAGKVQILEDRIIADSPLGGALILTGAGLLISPNGNNYTTAITPNGIDASVVTTGELKTNKVRIFSDNSQTFLWDDKGISAYMTQTSSSDPSPDYSKFVRFNKYGLYGLYGGTAENPTLLEIEENAQFALTWNGLVLNSKEDGNYVKLNAAGIKEDGTGKKKIIYAGDSTGDKFIVYQDGSIKATDGIFTGTIQAAKLQVKKGEVYVDVLTDDGKISSNYLDLGNIIIDGNNTTISLGNGGQIQIGNNENGLKITDNGITFGTGSNLAAVAFSGQYSDLKGTDDIQSKSGMKSFLSDFGITETSTTTIASKCIYSPNIVGEYLRIGQNTTQSYLSFSATGMNFIGTDSKKANEKNLIGLGYYSGNYTLPYIILGQGVDDSGTNAGMIKKYSNGLWLGDNDNRTSNTPGGTGLFVNLTNNKIQKYISGSVSDIGVAVLG